jgi:DNA-binding LacI/PurR family transcriptional regulator
MKRTQITIKDIALKLNISPSTVSRALGNHPDISDKTKELVNSLAKELDYHPDSIALSLKQRRTNLIGVIVPEIKNIFFSAAISGIEEIAYQAGFTIIVAQSNESYDRETLNIRALISNRIAGLLISISRNTTLGDQFKLLERRQIPFVFFDRVYAGIKASKVVVNDYSGAFNAVEYLIKSGYKRIAHLAGPRSLSVSQYRLQGYKSALRKFNIPYDERLVIFGGLDEEGGYNGFSKLLELDQVPDAVFAANDPVAIGAFEKIKEKGLRIPQDVALLGFCDNPVSRLVDPTITTVHQPAYEVGKNAAQLLIEQIKSPDNFVPKKIVLKTKLIIRNST